MTKTELEKKIESLLKENKIADIFDVLEKNIEDKDSKLYKDIALHHAYYAKAFEDYELERIDYKKLQATLYNIKSKLINDFFPRAVGKKDTNDMKDWEKALEDNTTRAIGEYLKKHPKGQFVEAARKKLKELNKSTKSFKSKKEEADFLFFKKQYRNARDVYLKALDCKDDPYVCERIKEINGLLIKRARRTAMILGILLLAVLAVSAIIIVYLMSNPEEKIIIKTVEKPVEKEEEYELPILGEDTLQDKTDSIKEIRKVEKQRYGMTSQQIWWCNLPDEWKSILMKEAGITDKMPDNSQIKRVLGISKLSIESKKVSSLEPLKHFIKLNKLDISDCKYITSLAPLRHIYSLTDLNCSGTAISSLKGLSDLNELEVLNCSNTRLKSLENTGILKNLTELDCSYNQIKNLTPLAKNTPNLKILKCNNTPVSDLSPLSSLKKLEILYCFNTQIKTLDPLFNLDKLRLLYYNEIDEDELSGFRAALPDCQVLVRAKDE